MKVLVSGGGTGGHIYPALSVAGKLKQLFDAEILYLGDKNGLETKIVPKASLPLVTIYAGKLRRYLSVQTVKDIFKVPVGICQAIGIMRKFKPDVVFTSGGYVAVPAGIAAKLNGVPLVMHQQDVMPNLSNRLLAPLATRVTVSFPDSVQYFNKQKTIFAGNPLREQIAEVALNDAAKVKTEFGLQQDVPVILVTGGSQGALHLNEVIVSSLKDMLPMAQVIHISGARTYTDTKAKAKEQLNGIPAEYTERYHLFEYLEEEMPKALKAADLVICRAGAATLSELAALGKPSILVPLPPGLGGSPQEANAAFFERTGASEVVKDKDLVAQELVNLIKRLLSDKDKLKRMSEAVSNIARGTAVDDIARLIQELAA